MKMRRMLSVLCAILFVLLTFTGCKKTPDPVPPVTTSEPSVKETPKPVEENPTENPSQGPKKGGILKLTGGKVGTLNPLAVTTTTEISTLGEICAELYHYFPSEDRTTFELKGHLAAELPKMMDKEGKVWQIKLHDGMKWANGDTLDVDDVMYTFKMCLDPKLLFPRASTLANDFVKIKNAEEYSLQGQEGAAPVAWEDVGIKKIDRLTMEITTEEMTNDTELMMHFAYEQLSPVYEPIFEKCMNEDRTQNTYGMDSDKFMSSGRYILEKWVRDSEYVFTRNPNYVYADQVNFDGINMRVVPDSNSAMQLFESGELDAVGLSNTYKMKYAEDPRMLTTPAGSVLHVCINAINPNQPILGNLNFRKALYYGTDREMAAKHTGSTPANFMVPIHHVIDASTGLRFRDSELGKANIEPNYSFEPEKAVQYFEKALQEEGVSSVSITFLYPDTSVYRELSEFLQKSWSILFGEDRFTITLQAMPNKALQDLRMSWKEKPDCYELTWGGWVGDAMAPWNAMKFWKSDFHLKDVTFESEEYDANYNRANFGEDRFEPGVREQCVATMEKILLDNVAMIPIYQGSKGTLLSDRFIPGMKNWSVMVGFAFDLGSFK